MKTLYYESPYGQKKFYNIAPFRHWAKTKFQKLMKYFFKMFRSSWVLLKFVATLGTTLGTMRKTFITAAARGTSVGIIKLFFAVICSLSSFMQNFKQNLSRNETVIPSVAFHLLSY